MHQQNLILMQVGFKMNNAKLQHRLLIQKAIIIVLSITLILLVVVSGTAAWYIRNKEDSATIVLANPVNIFITENTLEEILEEPLLSDNVIVYPGDKIKLKIGMTIGSDLEPSSDAYVRCKLVVGITTVEGIEEIDDYLYIDSTPLYENWVKVDFSEAQDESEMWYVYREDDNTAKVATNLDQITFIDGNIVLSLDMDNRFANKDINIYFIVQAIQVKNINDPIQYPTAFPWVFATPVEGE